VSPQLPPAGDPDARDFWAALGDGEFTVAVCRSCGHHWLPPMTSCPRCGATEVGQTSGSNHGTLATWTVIHRGADPAYASDAPYAVALLHLDDGTHLYGRVRDVPHEELHAGLRLQVMIEGGLWWFGPTKEGHDD
jgi:uncharacterized OB-fold protein